jgi:hypothetical protein
MMYERETVRERERGRGERARTTSTLTTYTLSDRTVAPLFMVECGKKMQDSTLWLMKQYRPLQERSCGISGFHREVDETALFWAIKQ